MRVIKRKALKDFWAKQPSAEQPLRSWYTENSQASWLHMMDVKAHYPNASVINNERIVFDIGGNKFRLVVFIDFQRYGMLIRFIGTHKEYDKIDVETI